MGRSKNECAAIDNARALSERVSQWLAFRYLFAQQYNAHRPQGNQGYTKNLAAKVAGAIVSALGGSLMAPPPPGLDNDQAWTEFIDAAKRVSMDVYPCLMRSIVDRNADREATKQMVRLHVLMISLQTQQAANSGGWVDGVGWVKQARRVKRKRS